jgi:hypothetical protein
MSCQPCPNEAFGSSCAFTLNGTDSETEVAKLIKLQPTLGLVWSNELDVQKQQGLFFSASIHNWLAHRNFS